MLGFLLRSLWRLIILLVGLSLVWLIATIYPYAHSRIPTIVLLFSIYLFFAYVGIPMLIRLLRIFIKPNHIPLYTTTGDGWPADPVNIAIASRSEKQLTKAMHNAGWFKADKATFKNSLREVYSIIFNQPYPTAPFSNLYLFDQPFDIGFQKPANDKMSARARHHVRFWRLQISVGEEQTAHVGFWYRHLRHLFHSEKTIWVGAAIDDTGPIGIRWRSGQLTHKNDTNTNKERDLVINDLVNARHVRSIDTLYAGDPFSFRGQTLGNNFVCDGTIKIVELKSTLTSPLKRARK
jgi:hypothetical protein